MTWSLKHGTEDGVCPFTVHTLTSEGYDTTSSEILKAMAAKHLDDGGKVLAIGHSKEPQSIWRNPKLYPQMFPWLFPYGLGVLVMERQRHKLSDAEHKRHLLLYHDKHFQKDPYFPLIAFNHEQMKIAPQVASFWKNKSLLTILQIICFKSIVKY